MKTQSFSPSGKFLSLLLGMLVGLLSTKAAYSHTDAEANAITEFEVFEVEGRSSNLLGIADSASTGVIGQAEFEFRPLLRPGELAEVIPGMMATQHSGSGKANQYFLRGFNLDHGTDFSAMVDGVPLNLPTHGHGQGYLDMNSIIPELIDIIEFGKGPYHAEVGDFSSAGYARYHTKHRLDKALLKFGIGVDDYYRGVAANSNQIGTGDLLYALEVNFYNGPWEKDEKLNKYNALLRYTVDEGDIGYALVATGYYSKWNSTEQIPQRAVDSGRISRLDTIDDSSGGEMQRFSLAGNWWKQSTAGETDLSFYVVYSDFELFSNFTYFLEDPVNGDQITQKDRRVVLGGEGKHRWENNWFGFDVNNSVGLQVRYDYIPEVSLHKSRARNLLATVNDHQVNQTSFGLYWENEIFWAEKFRSILGFRGDFYLFDVASRNISANSGNTSDAQFSPKLGFVLGPWYDTEYYLNLGYGFHSNDARGTTIQISPNDGSRVSQVEPLVASRGAELGLRTQWVPDLVSTLSLWWLELDSELIFVGDGGTTEPSGKSQRYGIEWSNHYRPWEWLTLDFDLSLSKAEFTDAPDGAKNVTNSVGRTISAGATLDFPNGIFGSLRVRHFGNIPLTEDGRVQAGSTTVVNLGTGYRYKNYRLEFNVLNLLDSKDNDINYFYASRLPGESASGVADLHAHPVEPRTFRIQATVEF